MRLGDACSTYRRQWRAAVLGILAVFSAWTFALQVPRPNLYGPRLSCSRDLVYTYDCFNSQPRLLYVALVDGVIWSGPYLIRTSWR